MNNYTNNTLSSNGLTTSELFILSDERIKTNVTNANSENALNILRLIEPKTYNYIDSVKKTSEPVWGFLAQQINNVLPYSVNFITEYIPNVFLPAKVNSSTIGTIISLTSGSTKFINFENSLNGKLKLYYQNNSNIVTIKEKLNDNQIVVYENLDVSEIFVYGQEVDNFNILKKDAIWTINVAAVKELDNQLQNEKQKNILLEQKINNLEQRLTAAGL